MTSPKSLLIPQQSNEEGGVLKVLTLGHSLALDCCHFLARIVAAEGYSRMQVGTLYYTGCPLSKHVEYLTDNDAIYNLYISDSQEPETPPSITNKVTMEYALQLDSWDVIVMQGGVFEITDDDAYKNGNIQTIQNYVRKMCPNHDPIFVWHMPWAPPVDDFLRDQYPYAENYYRNSYKPFHDSRTLVYNTIVKCVQDNIVPDETFRFVIPTGTTMENALSSYLVERDLHRDFVHATDFARVMNAYLWFCKFAGIEQLKDIKMDTIPVLFFNSTEGTQDRVLTPAEKNILLEAVNNALKMPFTMTQSAYTAAPCVKD